MKIETYKKYKKDFLQQYKLLPKNELGFVKLEMFKIRNFNLFLTFFRLDCKDLVFNNSVQSIGVKQFFVDKKAVTSIKINSEKSFLDKYPEQFECWVKHYCT